MTFPVRLATVDDAPACAAIVNRWIDNTPWMPRSFRPEEFTAMIAAGIPIREFWVAGDPVAGYLSLNTDTMQIMGLYTAHPGSGAGKALLDQVKVGRDTLNLWTHAANTVAHRFYRREGFVPNGDTRDGADGLPEIRMDWTRA